MVFIYVSMYTEMKVKSVALFITTTLSVRINIECIGTLTCCLLTENLQLLWLATKILILSIHLASMETQDHFLLGKGWTILFIHYLIHSSL